MLTRRLRAVAEEAGDGPGREAVRAAVAAMLDGSDREQRVRWRLVDAEGREIGDLDLRD